MGDKNYAVFDMSRENQFDDGNGNGVSLEDHVRYVDNYMGTPDCGIFCDTLAEAFEEAKMFKEGAGIVDLEEGSIVEVTEAQ